MRPIIYILLTITLLISCNEAVHSRNRIQINIPLPDTEAEYVWQIIQNIRFFEENDYQVSLPQANLIDLLIEKSRKKELTERDFKKLKTFISNQVYHKSDYEKGYAKIKNEEYLINNLVTQMSESKNDWKFKTFETYQVNLTLYGPGGSYDPGDGTILIRTTPEGTFKQYDNPANTIIHEIVHIGIDESIVEKFDVPHPLKERIVDTFVFLKFEKYLPNYRIQDMNDHRIDLFLKSENDIKNLANFVEQIMSKRESLRIKKIN